MSNEYSVIVYTEDQRVLRMVNIEYKLADQTARNHQDKGRLAIVQKSSVPEIQETYYPNGVIRVERGDEIATSYSEKPRGN